MNSLYLMMCLRLRNLITLFLLINCVTTSADENNVSPLKTSQLQPLAPFVGTSKTPKRSAPSVVMLPPRVLISSDAKVIEVATAAVDRLAGELSADGTIQVVNRTELKRLLDERKIAKGKQKPITSYSAMIRLEVVMKKKQPRTILTVLDLSTGNVIGEKEFGWSLKESDIPRMKKVCVDAIKKSNQQQGKKVRIRFVGVTETGGSPRLNSLANRTSLMFRESLAKSSKIMMLQHLEAQTSREESLLLLMGLSKLPGSKRFIPQANATIELRLLEKKSIGKTFTETVISVGVSLKENNDVKNNWSETTGKVKEIDKLIQQSWNQLALKLKGIHPETLTKTLDDFRTRHKQAEAELRSAIAGVELSHKKEVSSDKQLAQINQSIKHCETALKLDPTYAEAQYQLSKILCVKFNHFFSFDTTHSGGKQKAFEKKHEQLFRKMIIESARYLEHLGKDKEKSAKVFFQIAWYYATRERVTGNKSLWKNTTRLSKEDEDVLAGLKTILLRGADGGASSFQVAMYMKLLPVAGQGMKLANISVKEQRTFFYKVIKNIDTLFPKKNTSVNINNIKEMHLLRVSAQSRSLIRLKVAELLLHKGDLQSARNLVKETRSKEVPHQALFASNSSIVDGYFRTLREMVIKLKDPQALKEFDLWKLNLLKSNKTEVIHPIRLSNHKMLTLLYNTKKKPADKKHLLPSICLSNVDLYKFKSGNINPYYTRVKPIAVAQDRVYLLVQKELRKKYYLAYVSLDKSGSPIGAFKKVKNKWGKIYYQWDGFHFLPDEKNNHVMRGQVQQAWIDHDKNLVLAMFDDDTRPTQTGISIYSPQTKVWSHISEEEGVPVQVIESFFPLDNNRLYCAGTNDYSTSKSSFSHFIVNLETKAVKLLHKNSLDDSWKEGNIRSRVLKPIWWVDGKLNGPSSTDLMSDKPRKRSRGFWGISDFHEINGRRFISSDSKGLFEYDKHEKIVKHWRSLQTISQVLVPNVLEFSRLGDAPFHATVMAKSGKYLVFPMNSQIGLILFDPEEDIWYGPVGKFRGMQHGDGHIVLARKSMIGSDSGVWFYSPDNFAISGTRYVKSADIISIAKKAGRVQTTTQYQLKLRKKIDALPMEHRALAKFMSHHYSAAKIDLEQWLKEEPNNEQAIFLLGVVHDRFALKKIDIASNYYQQLIDLPNPSAKLTGMLCLLEIHRRANRWQKVIELGNQMINLSPLLPLNVKSQVAYRMKVAKEKIQHK